MEISFPPPPSVAGGMLARATAPPAAPPPPRLTGAPARSVARATPLEFGEFPSGGSASAAAAAHGSGGGGGGGQDSDGVVEAVLRQLRLDNEHVGLLDGFQPLF